MVWGIVYCVVVVRGKGIKKSEVCMEMKEEDYWYLVDEDWIVNGMNLGIILDKLGVGYDYEDIDWKRVGRMFMEKGWFDDEEIEFIKGVMEVIIKNEGKGDE